MILSNIVFNVCFIFLVRNLKNMSFYKTILEVKLITEKNTVLVGEQYIFTRRCHRVAAIADV